MINVPKKILQLEKDYAKNLKKVRKYEGVTNERKLYLTYKRKSQNIKNDIYKLLIPLLQETNNEFESIVKENYKLLETEKFILKTYKTGIGNQTTGFIGSIHNNGFIYCKATTELISFMTGLQFPKLFKGKIDCLGNISLTKVKSGFSLFRELPFSYTCHIASGGVITVYPNKTKTDASSNQAVYQIIGTPFKNKATLEQFLENKKELIEILENCRNKYLAENYNLIK